MSFISVMSFPARNASPNCQSGNNKIPAPSSAARINDSALSDQRRVPALPQYANRRCLLRSSGNLGAPNLLIYSSSELHPDSILLESSQSVGQENI